jgi:hypothetical protein
LGKHNVTTWRGYSPPSSFLLLPDNFYSFAIEAGKKRWSQSAKQTQTRKWQAKCSLSRRLWRNNPNKFHRFKTTYSTFIDWQPSLSFSANRQSPKMKYYVANNDLPGPKIKVGKVSAFITFYFLIFYFIVRTIIIISYWDKK